jgi:hypothetical protein
VHRKKDATDWGVQPQIAVPMDEVTEKKVMMELDQHERFLPPVPKRSATQPTTASATQPASSDIQLQRAVETMIGLIVMQTAKVTGGPTPPAEHAPRRTANQVPAMPDTMNPTSKPAAPTSKPATTRPTIPDATK